MEAHDNRALCLQLADDLGWLEEHCRRQADLAVHSGQLRLSAALVRNVVGPFLDGQPPLPLHVAVVGGAGSGKSTVANFLIGAAAAEANPQAGFTRHPVAYIQGSNGVAWPSYAGFLGPLRKLSQSAPSNLDEDVYQVRRATTAVGSNLLSEFVVWDCPDMTTWAATGYVSRLIEVCGLADVIVYVASDERYNDEVPTQFLQLLLQAGKPVVVVLTKMKEADTAAITEHFRREVLGRLAVKTDAVVAIPFLTPDELSDPVQKAARFRLPLLNQIAVLADPPAEARKRTVKAAANYLAASIDGLLSVARTDLAAMDVWKNLVETGRKSFDSRYFNEYLGGERFHRFDEAMVKLIEMLELPGVAGRIVSGTTYVLSTPYRGLKMLWQRFRRPDSPPVPEKPIMEHAVQAWLDYLRAESLRRSGMHPFWAHVNKGFDTTLPDGARAAFEDSFRQFHVGIGGEVELTSRSIYEDLKSRPALLNSLRTGKFALDLGGIISSIAIIPIAHTAWALLAMPAVTSTTQMLVEFFGQQYVENQRDQARRRQHELAQRLVSAPLAEWLAQWPISGGSSFERLQQVLRRIPLAIGEITAAVERAKPQAAGGS